MIVEEKMLCSVSRNSAWSGSSTLTRKDICVHGNAQLVTMLEPARSWLVNGNSRYEIIPAQVK